MNRVWPAPETRLILAGLGGQGVVFATRLVAQAAVALGWPVIAAETHGMSQRGGSVLSHVKLGPYLSSLIRRGTADVLLAFDPNEAVRALPFLRPGGVCVVNAEDGLGYDLDALLEQQAIAVHSLPATSIALALGSASLVNTVVVGFATELGCLPIPQGALRAYLEDLGPGRRERNLQALEAGTRAAAQSSRMAARETG